MAARPEPPVPTPTSRPTPERARRAEAIELPDMNGAAFRPWWRVRTRLDGLFAAGLIDLPAYEAAGRLRADWHRAGGHPGSALAGLGRARVAAAGRDAQGAMLGRLAAADRLRAARARLGAGAFALAVAVAAEDVPWTALGRRLGVSDKTARAAAAAAIRRLAGGP